MTALTPGDRATVSHDVTVMAVCADGLLVVKDERGHEYTVASQHCTKIPEPEPEWNRGDVVKYRLATAPDGEAYPALFNGDRWVDVDRDIVTADEMSGHWQAGRVEIVVRKAAS